LFVLIAVPVVIRPLPEETGILEGNSARIECEIAAGPNPEVSWVKDDEVLQEDDHITFEDDGDVHALVIQLAEEDDESEYKCVVTNAAGSVETKGEIVIEEGMALPVIKEGLKDVAAEKG